MSFPIKDLAATQVATLAMLAPLQLTNTTVYRLTCFLDARISEKTSKPANRPTARKFFSHSVVAILPTTTLQTILVPYHSLNSCGAPLVPRPTPGPMQRSHVLSAMLLWMDSTLISRASSPPHPYTRARPLATTRLAVMER